MQEMKLYVGNLTYSVTEAMLEECFGKHGQVKDVVIIKDKFTGRSKGFGFVEMSTPEEAKSAIDALNGTDFEGRLVMAYRKYDRNIRWIASTLL